jgi:hypothetical protein
LGQRSISSPRLRERARAAVATFRSRVIIVGKRYDEKIPSAQRRGNAG